MPDGFTVDFSGLASLNADLLSLQNLVPKKVDQALQQTALKTRDVWRRDAKQQAGPRTRGYAPSIDYDRLPDQRQDTLKYGIGPNLARYGGKTGKGGLQPSLGILEETPGGVAGSPRQSIAVAFGFAGPELEKGIRIAVDQSLGKAGF